MILKLLLLKFFIRDSNLLSYKEFFWSNDKFQNVTTTTSITLVIPTKIRDTVSLLFFSQGSNLLSYLKSLRSNDRFQKITSTTSNNLGSSLPQQYKQACKLPLEYLRLNYTAFNTVAATGLNYSIKDCCYLLQICSC